MDPVLAEQCTEDHSGFQHHAVRLVLHASARRVYVQFLLHCSTRCGAQWKLRSEGIVRMPHKDLVPKVGLEPTHYH